MIVVLGSSEETLISHVYRSLQERGMDCILLEQSNIPNSIKLNFETDGDAFGGYFRFGDHKRIELSEITSVYARPGVGYFEVYDYYTKEQIEYVNAECMVSLNLILEFADFLVLNRPSTSRSNASKPDQANMIRRYGFHVPETLVTNDPSAVKTFYEKWNRNLIYKSISSVRSIVKKMTDDDFNRLDTLKNCPIQIQECVEGSDIRVHVVGDLTFSALIHSGQSDYRYDKQTEMDPYDLPPEIASMCVNLAYGLGLPLAGIDLRVTPDGRYHCFEVNPSPVFTYYEQRTGLPITDAVCNLLASGVDPTRVS